MPFSLYPIYATTSVEGLTRANALARGYRITPSPPADAPPYISSKPKCSFLCTFFSSRMRRDAKTYDEEFGLQEHLRLHAETAKAYEKLVEKNDEAGYSTVTYDEFMALPLDEVGFTDKRQIEYGLKFMRQTSYGSDEKFADQSSEDSASSMREIDSYPNPVSVFLPSYSYLFFSPLNMHT